MVVAVAGSGMMQAAVGLEDPRSQLVLASAPASEDEDRLVHVADQCCLNLGYDDDWCLMDEEPLDPAELSTSGAPTCPEELSHSDRPPPPAELSDSAELCGSDRPSSSPAELSHCDAARPELPAEESRRESRWVTGFVVCVLKTHTVDLNICLRMGSTRCLLWTR